jgi:hypothetical protein
MWLPQDGLYDVEMIGCAEDTGHCCSITDESVVPWLKYYHEGERRICG